MFVDRQIDTVIAKMLEAGILPVITHPERNRALQQRVETLVRWLGEGCLLQITAQSLLGRFGSKSKRFAELLLSKNLVHIVASDAHDCKDRPPRLDLAFAYVTEHYNIALAQRLFVENPGKVLAGEAISDAGSGHAGRRWFHF
jgi:protein-tyrosine phosphatase